MNSSITTYRPDIGTYHTSHQSRASRCKILLFVYLAKYGDRIDNRKFIYVWTEWFCFGFDALWFEFTQIWWAAVHHHLYPLRRIYLASVWQQSLVGGRLICTKMNSLGITWHVPFYSDIQVPLYLNLSLFPTLCLHLSIALSNYESQQIERLTWSRWSMKIVNRKMEQGTTWNYFCVLFQQFRAKNSIHLAWIRERQEAKKTFSNERMQLAQARRETENLLGRGIHPHIWFDLLPIQFS